MKSHWMKSHWKTKVSIISTIVALIPLWIFLGVHHLFLPEESLQNLGIATLVFSLLGTAQLILLVILFGWLFVIWMRD